MGLEGGVSLARDDRAGIRRRARAGAELGFLLTDARIGYQFALRPFLLELKTGG